MTRFFPAGTLLRRQQFRCTAILKGWNVESQSMCYSLTPICNDFCRHLQHYWNTAIAGHWQIKVFTHTFFIMHILEVLANLISEFVLHTNIISDVELRVNVDPYVPGGAGDKIFVHSQVIIYSNHQAHTPRCTGINCSRKRMRQHVKYQTHQLMIKFYMCKYSMISKLWFKHSHKTVLSFVVEIIWSQHFPMHDCTFWSFWATDCSCNTYCTAILSIPGMLFASMTFSFWPTA